MIQDIKFDPIKRNLVIQDDDFVMTDTVDASTQNGTILLEARAMNLIQPQYGIGFDSQVQGGDVANATFEMNRCVGQVKDDGGQASWRSIPPPPNQQFDFSLQVSYPD